MNVVQARIMERLEAFSQFNDTPGAGISRFSYSSADLQARRHLLEVCSSLDLQVSVDAVGNLRARYPGSDPALAPVLLGSHMDSVRNGGKYDGMVGVIGALEVISVMHETGYQPRRSIDLIVFAEEEGSNFGTTMMGSKALVGKLDYQALGQLKAQDGRTCIQVLEDFGLQPQNLQQYVLRPGDVDSMVELHIEQGIVMEREHIQLGVVHAIAGMETLDIVVQGVSNHAGATPMKMRNDPMTAAAALILEIEQIATYQITPNTVATVGNIICEPNMPNVIPGCVSFSVDVRDISQQGIEQAVQQITNAAQKIAADRGVQIQINTIGTSAPINLSDRIMKVIENAVSMCSSSWRTINSGAVHDAAMMASVTDVGMIFIPSVKGKSHNAEEFTSAQDIALGCQALLLTAIELSSK